MSRINIIFLVAFVGALVAVFLQSPKSLERVQRGALSFFRPAVKSSTELSESVENFGDQQYTKAQLAELLNEARLERDKLRLEVLKFDEMSEENDALRSALNYVKNAPLRLVPSQVIGRKPTTWYNTIIIDKGADDLIEPDSPVIIPVGDYAGLVGKVSEVRNDNTSVIILLTDEMCQVSARIEGTADQGIISGQRGSLQRTPDLRLRLETEDDFKTALKTQPDLKLKYLPKLAKATAGRKVISAGAGDLFPENLLLGEVVDFRLGSIDAEAVVKPAVNFDTLKNVFVILPKDAGQPKVEPAEPDSTNPSSPTSPISSVTKVESTQISDQE